MSGIGKLDASRLAPQKLYPELSLKCTDLLTQRRLLDAEPRGGARDVAFFSDRDEISQVS